MKLADGIDIKTEHVVALGAGIFVLYVGKQLLEGATQGAAKGLAQGTVESINQTVDNFVKSVPNTANNTIEQTIYNNPWMAIALGHPEWQYMTPKEGYL